MSFLSIRLSSTAKTWNCDSAAATPIVLMQWSLEKNARKVEFDPFPLWFFFFFFVIWFVFVFLWIEKREEDEICIKIRPTKVKQDLIGFRRKIYQTFHFGIEFLRGINLKDCTRNRIQNLNMGFYIGIESLELGFYKTKKWNFTIGP